MKLGLLSFIIFSTLNPVLAMGLQLGECQGTAEKYILKGSTTDSFPGARLWNFKKFSKTFRDHEGSNCEKQAFDQALQESNEYWKNIEKKYKCPRHGIKQCDLVESNLAYIDTLEKLYDGSSVKDGLTVKNCQIEIDKKTKELGKDVFQIVEHLPVINSPVDECAHIPSKDRKGPYNNLSSTSVISAAISGCMVNIIKGFFNNISDLVKSLWDLMGIAYDMTKKFGGDIIDFLKAAWYGNTATFFSEHAAQGAGFFKDLTNSFKVIPQALYNAAATQMKDFQCMNQVARTELICKAAGYLGPEILLAVFTGGSGNVAKVATHSTKALSMVNRTDNASDLAKIAKQENNFAKAANKVDKVSDASRRAKPRDFRKALRDLGHKIDFEVPTEYFKKGVQYDKKDIVNYLKKIGASEEQLSSPQKLQRWCKRKASSVHPDLFARYKNEDLIKASTFEFQTFLNLCEVVGK